MKNKPRHKSNVTEVLSSVGVIKFWVNLNKAELNGVTTDVKTVGSKKTAAFDNTLFVWGLEDNNAIDFQFKKSIVGLRAVKEFANGRGISIMLSLSGFEFCELNPNGWVVGDPEQGNIEEMLKRMKEIESV